MTLELAIKSNDVGELGIFKEGVAIIVDDVKLSGVMASLNSKVVAIQIA